MTDAERGDLPRSIGRPATNALAVVGIRRLDQVAEMTDAELLALHGVGPKAVRLLREEMATRVGSTDGVVAGPAEQPGAADPTPP